MTVSRSVVVALLSSVKLAGALLTLTSGHHLK